MSQRVTNSSGTVVSTIELDPWGGNTSRNSNDAFQPRKFTTYERDANASDEAMHRRYNRWWSRFDQPDPYDGSYNAADPQSFNRYAYVGNDPVNFVDPTGLLPGEGCSANNSFADCYGTGGGGFWGGGWNFNDRGRPGQDVIGARETERDIAIQITRQFRYIPTNAHYLGGLNWGWTDLSQGPWPSYTYTFTVQRLSTLALWNGRFGWDGATLFRGVDGYPYQKGGLETDFGTQLGIGGLLRGLIGRSASGATAVLGNKLDYLFGRATGNAHNIGRSTGLLSQLQRIGIFDTAANRAYLQTYFNHVVRNSSNIIGRQANGSVIRESLLMGPNGGLKVTSFWQGDRLITVLLFGGP